MIKYEKTASGNKKLQLYYAKDTNITIVFSFLFVFLALVSFCWVVAQMINEIWKMSALSVVSCSNAALLTFLFWFSGWMFLEKIFLLL